MVGGRLMGDSSPGLEAEVRRGAWRLWRFFGGNPSSVKFFVWGFDFRFCGKICESSRRDVES